MTMIHKSLLSASTLSLFLASAAIAGQVQLVFTSDAHFGVNRGEYHGEKNVDARYANRDLVAKINTLNSVSFPADEELRAGQPVGGIDFVVEGGDISNRSEASGIIQSSESSWAEFEQYYINGLTLKNGAGNAAPLYIIPGNHDVSNAIGYYKRLDPKKDPTTVIEIYNRMMMPSVPLTAKTFDYSVHKVHYSHDINGVHFVFLNIWPDSTERAWLSEDLAKIQKETPVILFTHDEPEAETKHFTNPNGKNDINSTDKFENVISEQLKNGTKIEDKCVANERLMAAFMKEHTEIKAYFHGNSHDPDFKVYMGPDFDLALPTFSVDSPIKGERSAKKEEAATFEVVVIDTDNKKIAVREALWNAHPKDKDAGLEWGHHTTVDFREAPAPEAPAVQPAPVVAPVAAPAVDSTQAPAAPVAPAVEAAPAPVAAPVK